MIDSASIFGGRILIVDDQPANVQLLELMLQRAGYLRVTSTMDPTRVSALHRENRYDLILLDLHMPGMDGFEVIEALNEIETDSYLPVLVITAQPSEKLRALQAGAKDFISKPFETSEVLTRIHNMLEVRLLQEQTKAHSIHLEEVVQSRTLELRRREEMFRELVANIPEALLIRDVEAQVVRYANPAWEKLSGFALMPGDPVEKVHQAVHPDDVQWVSHERRQTSATQASSEYRLVHADGSERWVRARSFPITNSSGKQPWIVEIIEDVTLRREARRQLVHLARHDALTNLPNRTLLYETLRSAIAHVEAKQRLVSVLLIDIDFFKNVNDTLGHVIGDAVLCEFADRLTKCVRPEDTVGRLGGDEFAVIVMTPENVVGEGVEVAQRIQKALRNLFVIDGQSIHVTASIGIADCPADSSQVEALVRYADVAMYEAKAAGRNTYRCYTEEHSARAVEKSDVEFALRSAQDRGEFVLHYQPKVQIDTGKWESVEALIRWNRPGHGLVMPLHFIPVLEEMGLIVPVGAWVIDTACRQIREWAHSGMGRIRIAVNVSSKQVREEKFVSQVADLVREHRIDPGLLEFELTESTLMAHGDATDTALRDLKGLGISISIDDFGTGYSNLAYLKRFLVDTLKIDMTFIRDVTTNADAATIAIAIINMAHSLRLRVVAEGVETREQLEFLRVHGCDEAQGYFFSKPLAVDELSKYLRNQAASQDVNRQMQLRSAAHA